MNDYSPDDFLEEAYEDRTYVEDDENIEDEESVDDYADLERDDPMWMDADALASAGWGTDEDYGLFE